VLYIILGLAAFGILAAAGANRFGASVMSTHSPNCATQARYMAESGVRFATSYLRAATSQADLQARINTLNSHGDYVVDNTTGLKFFLAASMAGTGQVQMNATGGACNGGTQVALPPGSSGSAASVNVSNVAPGTGAVSLSNPADDFFTTTNLTGDSPIKIVGNSTVAITDTNSWQGTNVRVLTVTVTVGENKMVTLLTQERTNTSGANAGTLTLTTVIGGTTSTNVLVDGVTGCTMGFSGTADTTVFTVNFTLSNAAAQFSITAKPRNSIATPVTS
jgi:hypothetical protein